VEENVGQFLSKDDQPSVMQQINNTITGVYMFYLWFFFVSILSGSVLGDEGQIHFTCALFPVSILL